MVLEDKRIEMEGPRTNPGTRANHKVSAPPGSCAGPLILWMDEITPAPTLRLWLKPWVDMVFTRESIHSRVWKVVQDFVYPLS